MHNLKFDSMLAILNLFVRIYTLLAKSRGHQLSKKGVRISKSLDFI